jgi:hypothetical protein
VSNLGTVRAIPGRIDAVGVKGLGEVVMVGVAARAGTATVATSARTSCGRSRELLPWLKELARSRFARSALSSRPVVAPGPSS